MLSRVANSIYWMARYIERAENYARFMDVNQKLLLDLASKKEEQWAPMIIITGDRDLFESKYADYTRQNIVRFMVFDTDNPNSILSCLTKARENARTVREIISSEMWHQLNSFYLAVTEAIAQTTWEDELISELLQIIKTESHAFSGIMDSTFVHGEGWHFGIVGRYLERAEKTARILDMPYYYAQAHSENTSQPQEMLHWSALLKSASAYEMYRKQYGRLDINNIVEFLTLDRDFPRAMHFCLIHAERSLHAVTGTSIFSFSTRAEKELGKLRSEMDYTEINDILNPGVHAYLETFQGKHDTVSQAIYDTFFSS